VETHQTHKHEGQELRILGIGCDLCEDGERHTICNFTKMEPCKTYLCKKQANSYDCTSCDFKSSVGHYLKNHQRLIHDQKSEDVRIYFCPKCEFIGSQITSINIHNRSVHLEDKLYYCHKCEYSSFNYSDVKVHSKNVHKPRETVKSKTNGNRFQCEQCDFNALTKKLKIIYEKSVHEQYTGFECQSCDYKSYSMKNEISSKDNT
jgi:hypothetical protein